MIKGAEYRRFAEAFELTAQVAGEPLVLGADDAVSREPRSARFAPATPSLPTTQRRNSAALTLLRST